MTRPDRRAEAGFTLMEMLIVLVVIGLIAAVAVPQLMKMLGGAKHRAAAIQIETVSHAVDYYQMDVGTFPTSEQGLKALWTAPAGEAGWNGPYVRREKQLIDPWGNSFVYKLPGKTRPYEIVTLGADGKVGGTGDDADISSEQ
jgi:general secretion pathway protein G